MKIFYHNDLDGECSAALVYDRYKSHGITADLIKTDYNRPFDFSCVDEDEIVYLVDLSISGGNIEIVKSLMQTKTPSLVWIDHHEASVVNIEQSKNSWLRDIPGIRISHSRSLESGLPAYSGAALTSMYLAIVNDDLNSYYCAHSHDAMIESLQELRPTYEMPYAVMLVSDYDCWRFDYSNDTTEFKLAMDAHRLHPSSPEWPAIFSNASSATNYYIRCGSKIKQYVDQTNQDFADSHIFETTFDGIPCLAINRRSNSWVFGKRYGERPLHIAYDFDGKMWRYSIYSTDPNINCSEIAAKYGGGGHKDVAGFSLDYPVFK